MAYWPGPPEEMLEEVGTTSATELGRYGAVIHLRTPSAAFGYNHQNRLRTEAAVAAAEIDQKIEWAWQAHPRRFVIESRPDFLAKAAEALARIREVLPACCRRHVVPELDTGTSRCP